MSRPYKKNKYKYKYNKINEQALCSQARPIATGVLV